ncbi:MAG: tetratricopeptide repeat protein [Balneolaceae bacterium]
MTLTFILSLLFTFSLSSDSTKTDTPSASYGEMLEKGVSAFYETRWDEASTIFDEMKRKSPEDPRAYFFESMIPFWEYFFVHQKEELANEFLEISEVAVNFSEMELVENPDDTTLVLMLSGLHGYRSLVAAGEKEYRTAIQSGVTGFKYTRRLLSMDSERPDAQIGRGMFYYMMGSVPREARWITNMFGVKGDVKMGFDEIRKAAESESAVSNDAMMMLMYLYDKEERYEEALVYADRLTEKFPENVIFHYKKGQIYEKKGNVDSAVKSFNQVILLDNSYLMDLKELSKHHIEELRNVSMVLD